MRILIDTAPALAKRLQVLLSDHDTTTERSLQHLDVACFDGDGSRAMEFARAHTSTSVFFFGAYTNIVPMLEAGVADVIPCDGDLDARVLIALTRAERAPTGFEDQLVALIDESRDGITISTDQKIAFANRAFKEMLLDSGRDFVGRSCGLVCHPDDMAEVRAQNDACTRTGAPTEVTELRLLRSDGTTFCVRNWAMPLMFKGRPSIMRFMRAQPAEREVDDHMVLADRMASVGTLAAGVAHELNNPLAYVLANLQMVREGIGKGDGVFLEEVDAAIQGAHRMSDIVRDLKTFTREPTSATEVVDVVSTLRSALQMCENELRHRGKMQLKLDESLFVEINASRLCQVFVNLLINAAQAIDGTEQGVVEVSADTDERGWARITVRDNGPGIPADDMRRIFEPFFTTKAAIQGTGLGLSICRNLVTQARGELHVESAPGAGAKFTVYLPTTVRKRQPKTISSTPPARTWVKILVIDDERLIGRAMQRALSPHQVTVTTDGTDALEALTEQNFDLIFCDLMMPGLSGMEVYEKAVAIDVSLKTRFVFMTGGAFTPAAQTFLANTSSLVIEKPFNLKKVRAIAAEFAASST